MQRGNGAVLGKLNTPTTSVATGVWALNEVQRAVLNGSWPAAAIVDPYFDYTTLLLHGNGTNGAQNNTFLDSSTNNFTITRNGNTTQGTFTPYGSNWSNYFDGNGDQLTVANNAAFDVGSGDFTVEAWVYLTGTTGSVINYSNGQAANANFAWEVYQTSATSIQFAVVQSSTQYSASSTALVANAWNHFAGVRNGNTLTIYVNGVAGGTTASVTGVTVNNPSGATVKVSGYNNSTNMITGYVSNLRVVKGTAVYTSTFTPSTAPLTAITNTSLLTCQSNRFIDNSSNAFTITRNGDVSVQRFSPFNPTAPYAAGTIGGSGYFDGSGDYLQLADSTAWDLTGDYTIEMWLYKTSSSSQTFFMLGSGGSTSILLYQNASNSIIFLTSSAVITASTAAPLNQWNHLALVRSGSGSNNTVMYLNGVNVGQATNTASFTGDASNGVRIGAEYPTGFEYTGYISNVRVVKGTAVYTSAFTPPTAPLTAITNTQLLTNFTNGGIIDNAMMNDLETVGNAQISTSVSKFGGGSMYFDGSGDYLVSRDNTLLRLSGEDFTVEGWVYLTANQPQFDGGVASYGATTSSVGWTIAITGSSAGGTLNRLVYGVNASSSGGAPLYGVNGISLNTWTHIAVTKNGSTVRFFINGVLDTSGTVTATPTVSSSYLFYVGTQAYDPTATTRQFAGYIDDLRITKGYARYTANFTAPTAPFPDQ